MKNKSLNPRSLIKEANWKWTHLKNHEIRMCEICFAKGYVSMMKNNRSLKLELKNEKRGVFLKLKGIVAGKNTTTHMEFFFIPFQILVIVMHLNYWFLFFFFYTLEDLSFCSVWTEKLCSQLMFIFPKQELE